MQKENGNAQELMGATVLRGSSLQEYLSIHGRYSAKCFNKKKQLIWHDTIDNVVTDVGANYMLNQLFGGAQNTAYFLGLISLVSYTAPPAVGNTMTSHTGWYEAGNGVYYPNWSTPATNGRGTCVWSAASARAKALSSALSFIIATNAGTVKGCFIVTGPGAVVTNADTNGTLYSAGLFTGGDKAVGIGDTLQVSYSTSV